MFLSSCFFQHALRCVDLDGFSKCPQEFAMSLSRLLMTCVRAVRRLCGLVRHLSSSEPSFAIHAMCNHSRLVVIEPTAKQLFRKCWKRMKQYRVDRYTCLIFVSHPPLLLGLATKLDITKDLNPHDAMTPLQ
eukprot:1180388-Amphidinium_carterae.1